MKTTCFVFSFCGGNLWQDPVRKLKLAFCCFPFTGIAVEAPFWSIGSTILSRIVLFRPRLITQLFSGTLFPFFLVAPPPKTVFPKKGSLFLQGH